MTTLRAALAAAALASALGTSLAACSGGSAAAPGADGQAAAQTQVEQVFRDYYRALLARDFTAACALNAPETTAKLVENIAARGVRATTCEEALASVYTIPGAAAVADGIATTAEIKEVVVAGDDASITWSAEVEGQRPTVTNGLRRVDGRWLIFDTGGPPRSGPVGGGG